jgi:hypothetical protein
LTRVRIPGAGFVYLGIDMKVLGLCIAVVVAAVLAVNASFMLVSPRAWFRLPSWVLAKGTLTETKYAQGWRATELRFAGAIMLGAIAWVVFDLVVR